MHDSVYCDTQQQLEREQHHTKHSNGGSVGNERVGKKEEEEEEEEFMLCITEVILMECSSDCMCMYSSRQCRLLGVITEELTLITDQSSL